MPAVSESGLDAFLALCKQLPLARLEFTLRAKDPVLLSPGYQGNLVKGVIGASVRKTLCRKRSEDCETCGLQYACPYSRLFETPADAEGNRPGALAHPIVFEAPTLDNPQLEEGELFTFRATLFGEGIKFLPYLFVAAGLAAQQGLGKPLPATRRRGRMELLTLDQRLVSGNRKRLAGPRTSPQAPVAETLADYAGLVRHRKPRRVKVELLPPELKLLVKKRLIVEPSLPELVNAARWRLTLQLRNLKVDARGYHAGELLTACQAAPLVTSQFKRSDWSRYSGRQQQRVEYWGAVGWGEWEGVSPEAIAVLRAGEVLHLGKGTVYGLGGIKLTVNR